MLTAQAILPTAQRVPALPYRSLHSSQLEPLQVTPHRTEESTLAQAQNFYARYIRSNIPPFSLTRAFSYGQVPPLIGQQPPTFDLVLRHDGMASAIHTRRTRLQGNLKPDNWEELFDLLEYGDCQHITSYVNSMLDAHRDSPEIKDLLPQAIAIIISENNYKNLRDFLSWSKTTYGVEINLMDETTLYDCKRFCAYRGIEVKHMFVVVNLPLDTQDELGLTANEGEPGLTFVSEDLRELDQAIFIDGWALHLSNQVFTVDGAKNAYKDWLENGKYRIMLLNPRHNISRLFIN